VWYHLQARPGAARIDNAAWCDPEPTAGRENLTDHITFATGKGIAISEPKARPTSILGTKPKSQLATQRVQKGGGAGRDSHDSQDMQSQQRCATASGSSSIPAEIPLSSGQTSGIHFAEHSTRFLELVNSNTTVLCHTNCGRPAQGTAFFDMPFSTGRRYRLDIRVDSKPGRMCYFIGVRDARQSKHASEYTMILTHAHSLLRHDVCQVTPHQFGVDVGQTAIRAASCSLENLW
jgi:hypothetical protein